MHASVSNDRRDADGPHYLIDGRRVTGSPGALQAELAEAYARRGAGARPRCLCVGGGVEMYIARVGGAYLLKRMPGSAQGHDCGCPSFEPPPGVSGLGQVLGSAISEDPGDGSTTLKLAFPLTKVGRKAPVLGEAAGAETAATSGSKLSLRGLLHFLWEEAGFNRWSPAMANKRSWPVIRRHLLLACEGKQTRGAGLVEALFLPEAWDEAHKDEQAARRRGQLLRVASAPKGPRKLLVLLGEVRKIEPGRYGPRLVVKHAPELHFGLNADLYKAMRRRFETELSFWEEANANGGREGHLVVLGTFSVALNGQPCMEELVLMYVTRNWVPVEDAFDLEIVETLTQRARRFTKCLRYNLAGGEPLPAAVLTDAGEPPWALFALRPADPGSHREFVDELAAQAGLRTWIWSAADAAMPELPRAGGSNGGLGMDSANFDPWRASVREAAR